MEVELKVIHFSCLGPLCEPLGSNHVRVEGMSKEKYWSNFTMDPGKVTCEKCKEILRRQKIMT